MKVLTAMSGGVDSTAAAMILRDAGYEIGGAMMKLYGENNKAELAAAKKIAEKLNIRFFELDMSALFYEIVIKGFYASYMNGQTPNPCINCNKDMKFGAFLEHAAALGYEKIATGHYAVIEHDEKANRYLLKRALDTEKDQSYVLYTLSQKQLSSVLFPLGDKSKEQIRGYLKDRDMPNFNKKDSQDICFIENGDYREFLAETFHIHFEKGDFLSTDGKILGQHKGNAFYTVGQRRGLGISAANPLYVIKRDPLANTVTVGGEEDLLTAKFKLVNENFIMFDKLDKEMKVTAKIRYNQKAKPARIYYENHCLILEFDEKIKATSPGQSAVFYDGDYVVGGGVIV